jgi:hypothetical protein
VSDLTPEEQAAESRGEAAGEPPEAGTHDQPAEGGDEAVDES